MRLPDLSVPFLDLRVITRRSDQCVTTVSLLGRYGRREERWMILGEAALERNSSRSRGPWHLKAYLKNATDFEHDSAWALDLPLVGVEFVGVSYQSTMITAYVSPEAGADEDGRFAQFRVPPPGYDPGKHPEAVPCETCKGKHIIVPEGLYVPPFDPQLYALVAGRGVVIEFGVVRPREEQSDEG